jgi:aspartate-semialdehyde dehydrogenase
LADPKTKKNLKVALIGAETLLGKELTEVLETRGLGKGIVQFAGTGEGNFSEAEGEAVYLEPLEERTIRGTQALFIAGTPEGAQKAFELARAESGRLLIIDCTGHLEGHAESRILAPLVGDVELGNSWLIVVPHPAASALALMLKRLANYRKIRRVIADIFEPASERGKRGVSELHEQTTSLLSFKPVKKEIFDAQLSFNLLSSYGEDAPTKLGAVEQRIERHLATILNTEGLKASTPMPSLRVIGAPVFHGYSLSVWVEFETVINTQELGEALASARIEVRDATTEPPDNVAIAGQSGIIVGDIRIDRNDAHAAWLWVVGDNLRLTADSAADLVAKLAGSK